jgi:hypothetical protein
MHITRKLIVLTVSIVSVLAFAGPPAAGARKHHASIPAGYYQCWQTTSTVWPPTGARTYATSFARSFTLFANKTYNVLAEGTYDRYNHWTFDSGTLHFTTGPMWSGFRHAVGRYQKPGALMPHSTLNPTQRYPLVLRDARSGDSDTLPQHETLDHSFWYCKKR